MSTDDLGGSVYAAVYSGIHVYEMVCRGIAMMKRLSDSWLNATQILKVAGIEKGRRTKILEREVLIGQHEKIQGGYGKYQGTWVPHARGIELCKQYNVYEYVRPLVEHDPTEAGTKPDRTPTKAELKKLIKKDQRVSLKGMAGGKLPLLPNAGKRRNEKDSVANKRQRKVGGSSAASSPLAPEFPNGMNPSSSQGYAVPSTPAILPRRVEATRAVSHSTPHNQITYSSPAIPFNTEPTANSRTGGWEEPSSQTITETVDPMQQMQEEQTKHDRMLLMNIFLDDDPNFIPEWLASVAEEEKASDNIIHPKVNVDLIIDDQGHTAVHWSAALARISVLDLLLFERADARQLNYEGESALVRAVQVTNNYENQTFPDLLELLHDTIPLTDKNNRTVLHHIALTAGSAGREKAARYYADCLLSWIVRLAGGYQVGKQAEESPSSEESSQRGEGTVSSADFAAFLNLQDTHGDTALNLAARNGDRALVRMLLNAGSSASISNRVGLCPLDFGVDRIAYNSQDLLFSDDPFEEVEEPAATTPTASRDDRRAAIVTGSMDQFGSPTSNRTGKDTGLAAAAATQNLPQTPLRSVNRNGVSKNLFSALVSKSVQSSPLARNNSNGIQRQRDVSGGSKTFDDDTFLSSDEVWSPASAENRMRQSVMNIRQLMANLERDFSGEMRIKQEHFDGIKEQLRNTTIELAKARETIHQLHSKTEQLAEIKSRVGYLEETLARETSAVRDAIGALPPDSQSRTDLEALLESLLAAPTNDDSTLGNRDGEIDLPLIPNNKTVGSGNQMEGDDPQLLLEAVERMRIINQVYARRDTLLRERVAALRKRADVSERERQYRQIIASCCEISEADVDIWIDRLVSAVESTDDTL